MSNRQIHAVLTGDLIDSRSLMAPDLDRARRKMSEAVDTFEESRPGSIRGGIAFFRGDAWQLLLEVPELALRLALLMRASLRAATGADTRISIGVGSLDEVVEERISMSTGEAFVLSGRALDKLTVYFDLTGALPARVGAMADWFPATLHLCSDLTRRWTRRQAELVSIGLLLENATHEQIAKSVRPQVTKQTVQESLGGAGWRPLIEAVGTYEKTDWRRLLNEGDNRSNGLP